MDSEKPLVSIITVSYNAATTIEQTILSVLNQSYKNIEYIMIDGQSTDGTQAIIESYRNALAYYASEPDDGIYDAMNKGIQNATGDIIGIINSDDWYEKDAVEKVVNCFLNTDAELVYGNIWKINKNGTKKCSNKRPLKQLWYSMVIPHPSVFIRQEIYREYGTFNTNYKIAADYDLILRFFTQGIKFVYLDEIIANFRYGGISTTEILECADESRAIRMTYIEQCPEKEATLIKIEQKYSNAKFSVAIKNNPYLIYSVLQKKISDISDGVIIFGTGTWGEIIYKMLIQCDVLVRFFVDNNKKKWGIEVEGVLVQSPEKLKNCNGCVIVAVRDYTQEICDQLSEFNNCELQWITLEEIQNEVILRG